MPRKTSSTAAAAEAPPAVDAVPSATARLFGLAMDQIRHRSAGPLRKARELAAAAAQEGLSLPTADLALLAAFDAAPAVPAAEPAAD